MARKPKKPAGKGEPSGAPRKRKAKAKQVFAELPACLLPNVVSRPTAYDPSFCDLVLELGADGKGKAEMARAIGVDRGTLDTWAKQHPQFRQAMKTAYDWAMAWWETAGRINMVRQGFNANAWSFAMKNRFRGDYADRHTVEGNPEQPIITRVERRIIPSKRA